MKSFMKNEPSKILLYRLFFPVHAASNLNVGRLGDIGGLQKTTHTQ